MIEDCHRRFRDDEVVEELIALLETHVSAGWEERHIIPLVQVFFMLWLSAQSLSFFPLSILKTIMMHYTRGTSALRAARDVVRA